MNCPETVKLWLDTYTPEDITKAEILNLTPHDIVVYNEDGTSQLETFPKSGFVARVVSENEQTHLGEICGKVPVYSPQTSGTVEWPSELFTATHAGDAVIVSMLVAQIFLQSLKERKDPVWAFPIYVPDTSPTGVVRDDSGKIIGTKRLVQYFPVRHRPYVPLEKSVKTSLLALLRSAQ